MSALSQKPGMLAAALVLLAAGCKSDNPIKTYPVTGKVVYKSKGESAKRLAGGYVIFESVSDPAKVQVQGRIEDDGTFALGSLIDSRNVGGVVPGEYRGRVVPPTDEESGKPLRGLIDPRFGSFDKSGIRITIAAGKNDDITIEVEPPRR